ncbi:unnamed protein product, partial [Phaeothamnion confervicola]
MSLYNATSGGQWLNSSGWDSAADLCGWHGVSCDDDGNVTALILGANNLSGNFSAAVGFFELDSLASLDLSENFLPGPLPTALGAMASLRFLELS